MEELHKVHFRGLVAIEYEKEGTLKRTLQQEVAYARNLA